jgi:hypothetical protein
MSLIYYCTKCGLACVPFQNSSGEGGKYVHLDQDAAWQRKDGTVKNFHFAQADRAAGGSRYGN